MFIMHQIKGKVESQMKILDEIRAYSGTLTLSGLVQLVERINTRENNKLSQATGKIPIFKFEKEKAVSRFLCKHNLMF